MSDNEDGTSVDENVQDTEDNNTENDNGFIIIKCVTSMHLIHVIIINN